MTTKTEAKRAQGPKVSAEMMRSAYEAHTLAQMLYRQLAATRLYPTYVPPMQGHVPYAGAQQTPWTGMSYAAGQPTRLGPYHPAMGGIHPFYGNTFMPR